MPCLISSSSPNFSFQGMGSHFPTFSSYYSVIHSVTHSLPAHSQATTTTTDSLGRNDKSFTLHDHHPRTCKILMNFKLCSPHAKYNGIPTNNNVIITHYYSAEIKFLVPPHPQTWNETVEFNKRASDCSNVC